MLRRYVVDDQDLYSITRTSYNDSEGHADQREHRLGSSEGTKTDQSV